VASLRQAADSRTAAAGDYGDELVGSLPSASQARKARCRSSGAESLELLESVGRHERRYHPTVACNHDSFPGFGLPNTFGKLRLDAGGRQRPRHRYTPFVGE
jgi:hypothetical protein